MRTRGKRSRAFSAGALAIGLGLALAPSSASAAASVKASASANDTATYSCRATVTYPVEWNGGFDFQFVVTNTGTATFNSWVITFDAPSGDIAYTVWNGTVVQTGRHVVVHNYNSGPVAPGASANSVGGVVEGPTQGGFTNITCTAGVALTQ
ncbi:MAG TPA: cellulose binding domain-containing protein [Actinocrinis sp.]|nr:cellulose binding domain-containing protein [Actinocrinis sp.]